MNRLKFRVWDKSQSHFYYDYKIGGIHIRDNGFVSLNDVLNFDSDNLVFQQWTGLKDKEDREIYEGDIIIFDGKWDKDGNVLPPDYAPYEITRFGACLVAYLIQPPSPRSFFEHNEIIHLPCTNNHVIGHIFLNPELLK